MEENYRLSISIFIVYTVNKIVIQFDMEIELIFYQYKNKDI